MLSLGGVGGSVDRRLFDVGLARLLSLVSGFPTRGVRVAFASTGTGSTGEVLDAVEESDWDFDVSEDECEESCCGFSRLVAVSLTGLPVIGVYR